MKKLILCVVICLVIAAVALVLTAPHKTEERLESGVYSYAGFTAYIDGKNNLVLKKDGEELLSTSFTVQKGSERDEWMIITDKDLRVTVNHKICVVRFAKMGNILVLEFQFNNDKWYYPLMESGGNE